MKSILDVPATLERLETLGVGVAGYGTDRFPGFYLADSGHPVPWRLDTPEQVAAALRARDALGLDSALVIANPLPVAEQLDPALHARVLAEALAAAEREGVRGRDVTPFLLARFHAETGGEPARERPPRARQRAARRAHRRRPRRERMTVVVVGDLMSDVVAWASAPLAHASDTPAQITTHPGGGGANVAARLASQGVPTLLVARTGNDPAGRAAVADLRAAGVRTSVAVDPVRPTGTVVVIVEPTGERTMLPDRGANAALAPPTCRSRSCARPRTCISPATRCSTRARARPGSWRSSTRGRPG